MRIKIPELEMFKVDKLPGFKCKRCARCCTGKMVPIYEVDRMRLEILKEEKYFENSLKVEKIVTGAKEKMKMEQEQCVFLKDKRCTHYDLRPDTCRRHPFIVTKKVMLVSTTCPGIDWTSTSNSNDYDEASKNISKRIEHFLEAIR